MRVALMAMMLAISTPRQSLPAWAAAVLADKGFASTYARWDKLKPTFLVGDFNGDGGEDVAVFIIRKTTKQQGIAILHAGSTTAIVLGAGKVFGNGGADFEWLDSWKLYAKSANKGASAQSTLALRGDAIFVEKTESASALIYWDGTRYRWRQFGD